jgi:hypothetical protein
MFREARATVALTQDLEGRPILCELLRDTALGRDDGSRGGRGEVCVCVLLLQDLLQSCGKGGGKQVLCLLLQYLLQSCSNIRNRGVPSTRLVVLYQQFVGNWYVLPYGYNFSSMRGLTSILTMESCTQ